MKAVTSLSEIAATILVFMGFAASNSRTQLLAIHVRLDILATENTAKVLRIFLSFSPLSSIENVENIYTFFISLLDLKTLRIKEDKQTR